LSSVSYTRGSDDNDLLPWLKFAICVALIGLAGPALTRNGDIIARLTGLSRSWIGLVLVATATSLPELFTGVSAVTAADAPNIAVGDALGSCVFNLVMLVLLDELSREEPMYRHIDQGHILTAGFGVILIGSYANLHSLTSNQHGLARQPKAGACESPTCGHFYPNPAISVARPRSQLGF
jgi:Ca2+/Na+ antiporter